LSIWRQVWLLLSWWLQFGRTFLRSSASYDKHIRGLLLNKILEEGIRHVFHGLFVDSRMEGLKFAFLSLGCLNISAGFHLLEHTTILVRYHSSVLSIRRTVLFLFFAFLIAAMFLNLPTIFLHVEIGCGLCLDFVLYALSSFLFTFRN
jgi:hypothetical protein